MNGREATPGAEPTENGPGIPGCEAVDLVLTGQIPTPYNGGS